MIGKLRVAANKEELKDEIPGNSEISRESSDQVVVDTTWIVNEVEWLKTNATGEWTSS